MSVSFSGKGGDMSEINSISSRQEQARLCTKLRA